MAEHILLPFLPRITIHTLSHSVLSSPLINYGPGLQGIGFQHTTEDNVTGEVKHVAVKRHQLLDVIQKASDTGIRQRGATETSIQDEPRISRSWKRHCL